MKINNINKFAKVKSDIFEQRIYPEREQGYIVGEMKCFADTSLKRSEFFIGHYILKKQGEWSYDEIYYIW